MNRQDWLWAAAAAAMLTCVAAGLLDQLRRRRLGKGRPGWVSWPLVQVLSLFAAIALAMVAASA